MSKKETRNILVGTMPPDGTPYEFQFHLPAPDVAGEGLGVGGW